MRNKNVGYKKKFPSLVYLHHSKLNTEQLNATQKIAYHDYIGEWELRNL